MKRFSKPLGLALAVLSLVSAAPTAAAQEVPFRGSGTGSFIPSYGYNYAELHSLAYLPLLGRTGVNIEVDTNWLNPDDPGPVPVFGHVLFTTHAGNHRVILDVSAKQGAVATGKLGMDGIQQHPATGAAGIGGDVVRGIESGSGDAVHQ